MERRAKQYENNWCVYMHENRINDKKYIGITSRRPTRRWNNGEGYKHSPRFYCAIQKHGWDAFRHEVLFTDLTQAEAERLEVELIAKYETCDPSRGYNLAEGGRANIPCEETRRKISEALSGRQFSDTHRMNLSAAKKGHPVSAEARRKTSEAQKGKRKGEENTFARAVICVETGERYGSTADAARALGLSLCAVAKAARGERKTAAGYHWRYAEEVATND